ncbi:cyanophycin synthetase [bacterium]|nr:cyanophycin synthetase [bacterium]
MIVRNVRALRGPNLRTKQTVLEIQLAALAELPELHLAMDRIPGAMHEASMMLTGTHLEETVSSDTAAPDLILAKSFCELVWALQRFAGVPVEIAQCVPSSPKEGCLVVVQYREESTGRMAVDIADQWLQAELVGAAYDLIEAARTLRAHDQNVRLGPSTGAIVRAAVERGIPYRRLNEQSLVQLGYGSRQRKILAAETDRTSAIAEQIVQDKQLTKNLLQAVGAPVPQGREATSAEDAWDAALEIGLPVVVKPRDGSQGRGVAVNLMTCASVKAAYENAATRYEHILVEEYAPGADYRLLIIDNKLVAAARREPPQVTGDGVHSISELVQDVNLDPRRGEDHATSLSKIPLDAIALGVLSEQGLTTDSIPAAGQLVLLRRNANLSTGGSATDVTDLVHPEVAARAIDAVRMVGLDLAGVDVIAQDISQPLEAQRGKIVEINAAPGLRMHLEPSYGQGRPVGQAIINMMFPGEATGRIPLVAVTGVNGKTTTTRLTAHILRCWGKRTGMTCTDGVYIDDRRIDTGDCSGPRSARLVLSNPLVDAAVLETARGGMLREGLGFDAVDVAIVTNIGEGDHLGLNGIHSLEQLAKVKRMIVENVLPQGHAVLNLDDPLVMGMAEHCTGKVLLFSQQALHPRLVEHRQRGGKVVFTRQGSLYAAEGDWEARIADLSAIPLTMGGLIGFQVENAMAAAAGAWSLGVPFQTIRHALETFVNSSTTVPARFNVIRSRGATVIVDYGHNTSALQALLEAFGQLPHERRLIVYTAAGDRRDEDIVRQAEMIADGFDHWVMYEDACTRGRQDGDVIRLMKQGLTAARRLKSHVETRGEFRAIAMALDLLQPGDLLLIQADQVEEAIVFVEQHLQSALPANAWDSGEIPALKPECEPHALGEMKP